VLILITAVSFQLYCRLLNHLLDAHLFQPGAGPSDTSTNILLVSHGLFLQTLVRTALVLGTPDTAPADASRFDVFHGNAAFSVLELRVGAVSSGGDAAGRVVVRRTMYEGRMHRPRVREQRTHHEL